MLAAAANGSRDLWVGGDTPSKHPGKGCFQHFQTEHLDLVVSVYIFFQPKFLFALILIVLL